MDTLELPEEQQLMESVPLLRYKLVLCLQVEGCDPADHISRSVRSLAGRFAGPCMMMCFRQKADAAIG